MSYGKRMHLEFTATDRLRKAREAAGLSQAELADKIGVSRSTVSRVESGGLVRPIVWNAWAGVTGVPLDWLRTGDSAALAS